MDKNFKEKLKTLFADKKVRAITATALGVIVLGGIIAGSVAGCILSIFSFPYRLGEWIQMLPEILYEMITFTTLVAIGSFSGIFVGCLALALAEMIDSIPIFARRIGFRHGIGVAVIATALGKLCGSVLYFSMHFYE